MSNKEMIATRGSVYETIDPKNARELKLKADIVMTLETIVRNRNLTQVQVGKILGVQQPVISRLFKGHFDDFSIARLLDFLTYFDRDIAIVTEKRDVAGRGNIQYVAA